MASTDELTQLDDAAKALDGEASKADGGDVSAREMMAVFRKDEDGTNALKETMSTYSTASIEGVTKKGDKMLPAKDMPACLAALKGLIDQAKAKNAKKAKKWEFRASPHELFGKSLDDTLVAFLMWARVAANVDDQDDDDDGKAGMVNIHKAFRRLEAYADWMEENGDELLAVPMTAKSVVPALKAWAMSLSYAADGTLVWWIDMASIDHKAIKETVSVEDSMRCFVWLAHAVVYDEKAQLNGLTFVENCASLSFWQTMTLAPMKLSVKLDKLTMGVIPVKMKLLLILDTPRWMNVLMKIFSLFMSKKLMKRMRTYKKEWEKVAEMVGAECIPKGFGGCAGTLTVDPVIDAYLAKEGVGAMAIS